MKGIDVSKYQGTIDWEKVKASGIEFAILRAGYGKEISQKDPTFECNYSECKRLGIPVGCYWYSYASTEYAVKKEAETCLEAIKGKTFEIGVWFDQEYEPAIKALTAAKKTLLINVFCGIIRVAGYTDGLYCSYDWYKNRISTVTLTTENIWIARYGSSKCGVDKANIWQSTSTGKVDGISGNVDMDTLVKPLNITTAVAKPTPDLGTATLRRTIGSKFVYNKYVANLQNALNSLDYACGKADGKFGANTETAVKRFQNDRGLTVDGVVGAKTKAKIKEVW